MKNKALTLTIIANITSNYSMNIRSVKIIQKTYKEGRSYAIRTKESMKQALMLQTGFTSELNIDKKGKTIYKNADKLDNVSSNRALEAGYMNITKTPLIRKSSFYLTDAISLTPFTNELRLHNNLTLANIQSKNNGNSPSENGLTPYLCEFDDSMKKYSITIDLDRIGVDENFKVECRKEEKIYRVHKILDALNNFSLLVNGNLDNAEPLFVIGGLGKFKTHYFDNVISTNENKLLISDKLLQKLNEGYYVGFDRINIFRNEDKIEEILKPLSISKFFEQLKMEVKRYYEGIKN